MISLDNLAGSLKPDNTVLLFGAGSSIPSGAPSSLTLIQALASKFSIDASDLDLREASTIVETRHARSQLIDHGSGSHGSCAGVRRDGDVRFAQRVRFGLIFESKISLHQGC